MASENPNLVLIQFRNGFDDPKTIDRQRINSDLLQDVMLGLDSTLSFNPVRCNGSLNNEVTTISSRLFSQDLIEGLPKLLPFLFGHRFTLGGFQEAPTCLD